MILDLPLDKKHVFSSYKDIDKQRAWESMDPFTVSKNKGLGCTSKRFIALNLSEDIL